MPPKRETRQPIKPSYPGTRLRSFRIEDDLYADAREVAEARGEHLSDVVRAGLSRYVKRHKPK